MKALLMGIVIVLAALIAGCAAAGTYRDPGAASMYQFDELDSYGVWVSLTPYGRVWKPDVGLDWAPFEYGHWEYTEPEWTWVSDEPFGWLVYHYGNWVYAPEYDSWVWVPGDGQWSPARVEWRNYGDYVCWAPLPPRGVALPQPWERYEGGTRVWNVVRAGDFTNDNVGRFRVQGPEVRPEGPGVRIFNRTPDPKMIEQRSGRAVRNVKIEREPVRMGNREFQKMRVPPAEPQRTEKAKSKTE